VLEQKNGT